MSEGPSPPADARWLNLAISALVALYLSYTWSVDAPLNASGSEEQFWYLTDRIYKWSLTIAAAGLIAAALALLARQRIGLLIGALAEGWFALTLAVMAIDLLVEPPMQFDITLIVLVVVMLMTGSQALHLWQSYRVRVPTMCERCHNQMATFHHYDVHAADGRTLKSNTRHLCDACAAAESRDPRTPA